MQSVADGTWSRLKACREDDCHWAFYDRSRNRSGQWCVMAVCGNRNKARAVPRAAQGRVSGRDRYDAVGAAAHMVSRISRT